MFMNQTVEDKNNLQFGCLFFIEHSGWRDHYESPKNSLSIICDSCMGSLWFLKFICSTRVTRETRVCVCQVAVSIDPPSPSRCQMMSWGTCIYMEPSQVIVSSTCYDRSHRTAFPPTWLHHQPSDVVLLTASNVKYLFYFTLFGRFVINCKLDFELIALQWLRSGDIWACQSSVGSSDIQLDQVSGVAASSALVEILLLNRRFYRSVTSAVIHTPYIYKCVKGYRVIGKQLNMVSSPLVVVAIDDVCFSLYWMLGYIVDSPWGFSPPCPAIASHNPINTQEMSAWLNYSLTGLLDKWGNLQFQFTFSAEGHKLYEDFVHLLSPVIRLTSYDRERYFTMIDLPNYSQPASFGAL